MNRREFLQTSAAAVAAGSVMPGLRGVAQSAAAHAEAWPENGTLIPDEGWRIWVDRKAVWKDDVIFLPEDVAQDGNGVVMGKGKALPVNAPTGGWGVLRGTAEGSVAVVLPSSVEQHFWGKFGERPYAPEEYRYAADDPIPMNGAYLGVSWWYKAIEIPAAMQGKRIFLHVRGAHLRAEVYLNESLVGYSIMEELPFECDLTHAAKPGGENLLAIRITNPFGRYDWVDGLNEQWGAVKLYRSHGFGGLDRGMTISAHDGVRIKAAWVLNRSIPTKVQLNALIESFDSADPAYTVTCNVIDPSKPNIPLTGAAQSTTDLQSLSCSDRIAVDGVEGGKCAINPSQTSQGLKHVALEIDLPDAKQWSLNNPKLYAMQIKATTKSGKKDSHTVAFAFRSFAVEGLGTNALFRLNGKRTKIYTSISWGYWGLNGMWPVPELAEKEVTQAKKLNLNCLNFHRNLAKEDVLRAHDRLGLLRYMEPGAGKMSIGKPPSDVPASANSVVMEKAQGTDDKFAQRYMFVKCVEMVKAFRSHTCVIEYCVQNEIGADLKNPDTIAVLEAMHKEDPSRCVVLNDGFVAPPRKAAQAWFEPWNDKLHRSDEEEWGGWWNQHQGAGDQWYDEFYKGPQEFTYKSPERKVISEFGEMEGCATPDNHSQMVHQIRETYKKYGGDSYDLADHEAVIAAYDKFLDRWGFRPAFPAVEKLWLALGKKCYETWQNYMENARISDELDFCAISGWESTAIENHSGIVDNLRNFKSDPAPIADTLRPVRPVAKQRAACVAAGESATFDLFLLNDTDAVASGTLKFTAVSPSGKLVQLGEFPAPAHVRDQFSYLVKEAFVTPKLNEDGLWRFRFAISSVPDATQVKEIWVTEPPAVKRVKALDVAVAGVTPAMRRHLEELAPRLGLSVHEFAAGEKYDVIVAAGVTAKVATTQSAGDTTGLEAQPQSDQGPVQTTSQLGQMDAAVIEAVRAGVPLLAIPQADALSEGVAKQLAAAGAFEYSGTVGDFRAPWMGNWYFVRKHAIYEGMPVDQAMGIHYQAKGRESNGLLVDGPNVEIVAAYSRDHDRRIGAGTFTTKLGKGKVLYQRVPELQPVMQRRFLANALRWLTS